MFFSYFETIGLDKYKEVKYVMKVILTLNHGQASVQCGFGINKSALKVKRVSCFQETN